MLRRRRLQVERRRKRVLLGSEEIHLNIKYCLTRCIIKTNHPALHRLIISKLLHFSTFVSYMMSYIIYKSAHTQ